MKVVVWRLVPVSVVQMIGFCLLLQFVLQTIFFPVRVLFLNLFTGKPLNDFSRLAPCNRNSGIADLYRFSLFFISPQFFALVAGTMRYP